MTTMTLPATVNRRRPVQVEISRIMQILPHMSATALFMRNHVYEAGTRGTVAATDSKTMFLWPAFFSEYDFEERVFILVHEILHAAFAHPQRGALLARRIGDKFSHDRFGIACDGLVNGAIMSDRIVQGGKPAAKVPADLVTMRLLIEQAESIVKLTGRKDIPIGRLHSLAKLSVETIYAILTELEDAAREHRRETPEDGGGAGGAGSAKDEANLDGFLDLMGRPSDIRSRDLMAVDPDQVREMIRQASDRLKSSERMQGQGLHPGGLMEALNGDIPISTTPWERTFRTLTQKYLSRERIHDHRRPGRRVLTQKALGAKDIIWHPARKRAPVPLVVVVTDSSGSIDHDEYMTYLSEIQAMKRRTNARIISIVADAAIQSETEIDNVSDLRRIEFSGRGGTDFRPAFARAEELRADAVVYCTDLAGTFPAKTPTMPVIWAVSTKYGADKSRLPFGRLVEISN